MGAPPDDPRGWPVKIKDPWDNRKTLAEVWLKDSSMSTSGSYEKFFRAEGRVYAHIMDPRTGYPARGSVSVSVIAPRTVDLSLIHISEPTRLGMISYAVFCLKKK